MYENTGNMHTSDIVQFDITFFPANDQLAQQEKKP
jgi:hypothetical protein